MIEGKTDWEFACQWYGVDEIEQSIKRDLDPLTGAVDRIPIDVASREFAEWLADQYRLAMRKGMELKERAMLREAETQGGSCDGV